ncbi:MAG TPA: alpha/beta hydrolase [Trichormus sp.]|jgi:esterase/lipase superfamily enzyme
MPRVSLLFWLIISVLAWSQPAVLSQDLSVLHKHASRTSGKHFPVFIVTDREIRHLATGDDYTANRSSYQNYAVYSPSDPAAKKIDRHDVRALGSENEFLNLLKATGARKIAVFVHGYRKSFDGSLDFAQRIADQVDAPVVLFAWPSKNSYTAYMTDECTAEWSSYHLAGLLHALGTHFGDGNIDVISHSLGGRMVAWSLRVLATQNQLKEPFDTLLFFSPDIDRDTFLAESPFIKQSCSTVKVYLDAHDSRIWISKMLHGSPRVGTTDDTDTNAKLSEMFQFDTTMPSHQIPFPIISAAIHQPIAVSHVGRN